MISGRNNNKKWIRNNNREPKSNDELHYEELREFAQDGSNRYCFDCHQRGPTYVNMTIGSFVCMRCSGLLRGLTPPHRVKSMSMTTFTSDEMEFLRERGNDYSKQVWLSLFEGNVLTESSDEQEIRDFMIQKYERKRYYVDPKVSGVQLRSTNTNSSSSSAENINTTNGNGEDEFLKNWKSIPANGVQNGYDKSILRDRNQIRSNKNGTPSISTPPPKVTSTVTNGVTADFVVDFSKADIFVAEAPKGPTQNGNNHVNNNSQTSFANFDNNPIFNASNQKPIVQSKLASQLSSPPSEDRYAALKDLDNALKTQQQYNDTVQQQQQAVADWVNSSPNGFQFNTLSPQSSVSSFGSPMFDQFQFINNKDTSSTIMNPFSTGTPWGTTQSPQEYNNPNPFRQSGNNGFGNNTTNTSTPQQIITNSNNGTTNYAMQQTGFYNNRAQGFPTSNSTSHTNGFGESIAFNPFKLSVSPGQAAVVSSNPFL